MSNHDAAQALDSCERATTAARATVASVTADDLSKPTPCDAWTMRDLIDHMSGVCFAHAEGLAGATVDRDRLVALFGQDPTTTFDAAATRALTAYQEPNALARELVMPWGPMPAATMVEFLTIELLLHAWDVATALGRSFVMDEVVAERALAVLQTMSEAQRQTGFAPVVAVAAEASAQDRLLAYSGRQPADGAFGRTKSV